MTTERVIIITGGASGIGKATAYKLAEVGVKLVIADLNYHLAQEVAEKINAQGDQAVAYQVDVSQEEQVEAMIEFAVEQFGTITGIFNNAGIGLVKPFLKMDSASYRKIIEVDQDGVYFGSYYAGKKMVELGVENGVIVNVASAYGYVGVRGNSAYSAAKAAVVAMTRSVALELAPYNIRVVGVAPGYIDTPIMDILDPEFKERLAKQHMRKKFIPTEKIATVVRFLFSEESDAINGVTVPVDDGCLSFR